MKLNNPIFISLITLVFGWFAVPVLQSTFRDVGQASDTTLIELPPWQKKIELDISNNSRDIALANVERAQLFNASNEHGWRLAEYAKSQSLHRATLSKIERELTKVRIEAAKQTSIINARYGQQIPGSQ